MKLYKFKTADELRELAAATVSKTDYKEALRRVRMWEGACNERAKESQLLQSIIDEQKYKLEVAKEAMAKAADQIKRRMEWNSDTSGTWQILNDALALINQPTKENDK